MVKLEFENRKEKNKGEDEEKGRPCRLLKLLQVYHFTDSCKVCELEYFALSSSALTSPNEQSHPVKPIGGCLYLCLICSFHKEDKHEQSRCRSGPADRLYSMQLPSGL